MAGILTKFGGDRNDCSIAFMVVGPTELCDKVSTALHQTARKRKCHILVHQCELITQVKKYNVNLGLDFIICVCDWRTSNSVYEVQANIDLINQHFITSGSMCLVNCKELSNIMGLTYHKLIKISDKYNIPFLSANILESQSCMKLTDRILNLAEATLGLKNAKRIARMTAMRRNVVVVVIPRREVTVATHLRAPLVIKGKVDVEAKQRSIHRARINVS